MNLKKKIAIILASTLVMTAMPVMTWAEQAQDSIDYTLEKTGYKFTLETAPQIKIELKDAIKYTGKDIVFYVELQNAKWLSEIERAGNETNFKNVSLTILKSDVLEVRVKENQAIGDYYIPLITELIGGEAKVKIDGNGTQVSDMKFSLFADTSDKNIVIAAGEPLAVKQEGQIADITIQEVVKGSLAEGLGEQDRTITLGIDNADLEFESSDVTLVATKGFEGIKGIKSKYVSDAKGKVDKGALQIILPQISGQRESGKLKISGMKVKGVHPVKGAINVTVSSYAIGKIRVQVGEVKDYGITLAMKNNRSVSIAPASKEKVSFSIAEAVPSSMVEGRTINVKCSNGYLSPFKGASKEDIIIGKMLLNGVVVKNQFNMIPIIEDGFIVGFTLYIPKLQPDNANVIAFEDMAIYTSNAAKGEVTLSAEGRDIEKTLSVVAAVVEPKIQMSVSPAYLKYGVKDQKGGKITLSETDKGMIQEGVIRLELDDEDGIWFEDKPTVKVIEGNIEIGKINYSEKDPRIIEITVTKASRKASVIEISDFIITADATVADGSYGVNVSGDSLGIESDLTSKIDVGFIFIGDQPVSPSVPSVPAQPSAVKKTAKFTLGSTTYYVNNEAKVMDAKAYAADNRTMVPIKYVSEIAGVDPKNISFDKGIVTITAKNKVIQLEQGSNVAKVNGANIIIDGKVTLQGGRVYVPVSQIASLLDIKVTWDAGTKTAVFEN